MSIIEHDRIIQTLQDRLSSTLTVDAMDMVVTAIKDILGEYDIHQIIPEDCGNDFMLDAFLDAIRVEGRSDSTIERYRYVIDRMLKAAATVTKNVTTYHIRKYLSDEKNRGISDGTIEGYRQIFSSYFNWLYREELITKNPMRNIGKIKCPKMKKKAYSDVDIEKLKWKCKTKRDRAIVCFLLATACRISEMTGLNRDNVDLERMECTVFGKGKKERIAYLDPVAVMTIREYLATRTDNEEALFVNRYGKRIHPGGVRAMLKKLGISAEVDNVHPHRFRRTKATDLIKHGMPIQEVASILGHDKLDTTMKYVDMNQNDVKNSYQKYA